MEEDFFDYNKLIDLDVDRDVSDFKYCITNYLDKIKKLDIKISDPKFYRAINSLEKRLTSFGNLDGLTSFSSFAYVS